jgi:hypothetical protein
MDAQVTTFSEMSTFSICRTRWFYDYVMKIKPKVTPKPLYIGSLVHAAQEYYYNEKLQGRTVTPEALGAYFGTLAQEQHNRIVELHPEVDSRTLELSDAADLGAAMVNGWARHIASQDKFTIATGITTKSGEPLHPIEIFGNVPILTPKGNPSTKFRYGFKCDTIVEMYGKLFLREAKTAKAWSEKDLLSIARDPQTLGYAWGFEQLTGKLLEGVIYDVIVKAGIRLCKNETPEEFRRRLVAEYTNNPDKYFRRHTLYFDKRLIEDRGRVIWEMSKDLADPFIYQTSSQWNTCRMGCRFLDLCNAKNEQERNDIIAMEYTKKDAKHEELEKADSEED